MYLSSWKFFPNQIFLDYLGRWCNQSCQIFFQSVTRVSLARGQTSSFSVQTVDGHYNCCTTVQLWVLEKLEKIFKFLTGLCQVMSSSSLSFILKTSIFPRSAKVRRSSQNEAPPHIPEHCPFKVQAKHLHIILRNCLAGAAPKYLSEVCQSTSSTSGRQHLRSALRNDLLVPRVRTANYGARGFAVSGPRLWNSFPMSVRELYNKPEQFKKALKTFLMQQ